MTEKTGEQMSWFDQDTWCGRMSWEPCLPPEETTKERTSKPSSRKRSASATQAPLMCLCLKAGGLNTESSTTSWEDGALPIGSMMLSSGAFLRDGSDWLWLPTSTDSQRQRSYLTLNCGLKPRIPNPTKLSQILEQNVDERFTLSPKACQGVLNRAAKRGKELPKALLEALTDQAQSLSKSEQENGGVRESLSKTNTPEPCPQPSSSTPSEGEMQAFGFSSMDPNAMKSPNPHSGIYKADTTRTLDLNGGNPGCNQGGVAVLSYAVNCRNGTENHFVNGTLQAMGQGTNLNSNNVVRVPNPNHPTRIASRTQEEAGGTKATSQKPSEPHAEETAQKQTSSSDDLEICGVDAYNGYLTGEIATTLTANTGQSANHAGPSVMTAGFSFGQSAKAMGIGWQEECSPTIRGGEGGNQKPHILIHERE